MSGLLVVLSAPSGGGKSTLSREILRRVQGLCYSVSVTTRPPRPGEKNDRDYHFVSEKEFFSKKEADELLEYARVHGYWYGTPKHFIEKNLLQGVDVLLDIDVQGGKQIKKIYPDALLIFIVPPSLAILERRLRTRRQDDEATIQKRLEVAQSEFNAARDYDYLVLNEKIGQAVDQLRCIIVAERLRVQRSQLSLSLK